MVLRSGDVLRRVEVEDGAVEVSGRAGVGGGTLEDEIEVADHGGFDGIYRET